VNCFACSKKGHIVTDCPDKKKVAAYRAKRAAESGQPKNDVVQKD
jgi:hypothetical protein